MHLTQPELLLRRPTIALAFLLLIATPALGAPTLSSPYLGLREQALHVTANVAGATEGAPDNAPYGLVTDLAFPNGTATIVALADGTASMYYSGGGGFLGGIGVPSIRAAAINAVKSARSALMLLRPTKE